MTSKEDEEAVKLGASMLLREYSHYNLHIAGGDLRPSNWLRPPSTSHLGRFDFGINQKAFVVSGRRNVVCHESILL
jgi:hypothetical protein